MKQKKKEMARKEKRTMWTTVAVTVMLVNKGKYHVLIAIGRRSSTGTKIGCNSHREDVEAEEES